tara:strand:+ start:509 stop:751 length:243 start_codon:yes stop_codon:yes gene_type:complete
MKEEKPRTFGNRCTRCGDYLEDGVCRCYDHKEGYYLISNNLFWKQKRKELGSEKLKRVCSLCAGKPCICSVLKGTGISLN